MHMHMYVYVHNTYLPRSQARVKCQSSTDLTLSSIIFQYNDTVSNIIRSTMVNQVGSGQCTSNVFPNSQAATSTAASTGCDETIGAKSAIVPHAVQRGLSKTEGPVHNDKGLLYGLQQGISNQSLGSSIFLSGHELSTDLSAPLELTAADMSLSALYLHELHHRQVRCRITFSPREQTDQRNVSRITGSEKRLLSRDGDEEYMAAESCSRTCHASRS